MLLYYINIEFGGIVMVICVGTIVKAQGLKGEVKVYPDSDISFLQNLSYVFLSENDTYKRKVKSVRVYKDMAYLLLEGVTSRDIAESMVGTKLYVEKDDIMLEENEYLADEIIGYSVLLDNGEEYGEVKEINNYGATEIFVIEGMYGTWQVPNVPGLITLVDQSSKTIVFSKVRFNEVRV